ncbi:aminotransferase class I/II-fold pyridoxal phosphate-dependent enzyme, partial [bacterium]|nr:aminotransferase class I/II-fold pyridoxal phosphate-dependent enzyme [bacterium]
MDLPVILGGERILDHTLNFSVPTLPPFEDVAPYLEGVYRSGWLTKGPCLKKFEEKMSDMLQVKHAIGVSSCTAGLILALQSLHLEKGGEVIVPSFSFMATFHAIWWNNLKPVFVDCEPDTFTIDVEKVREAINEKTVAVAAVSVFGNPPDLQSLEKLCEEHNLPLFFDSAHGLGTFFRGEPLGGHGRFEVFSLSPTKLLTGGEGGLVTTSDDEIAAHVIAGRDYGNP